MCPRSTLAMLACAAALPAAAAGDIVRCVAAGGGITYQQTPCPDATLSEPARIATEYPQVNQAERERLFQREAAMYQRLEAQRDRQVTEAALRNAAEERRLEREAAARAAAQATQVYWPAYAVARPGRARGYPRTHPYSMAR